MNTSVYRLISSLNGYISRGRSAYSEIQEKGAVQTTTMLLKDAAKPILDNIDKEIERLKKSSAKDSYRDRLIKELEEKKKKFTFDESKVREYYSGNLGDSNFFSSMFESYTTNPDPIISTFALFLKQNLSKITSQYFEKSRVFMDEIRPIMQRLGMDQNDVRKTWSEYTDKGVRPIKDKETGRVIAQEVLSFMDKTLNGKFFLRQAELKEKIEDAKKENDRQKLIDAYKEQEAFLQKYSNREYKREYYESRKELLEKNPDAFDKLEDINRRIRDAENKYPGDVDFFEAHDELTTLYQEKKNLFSEYTNGVLKLQKDRDIAIALSENQKKNSKFYETVDKPGSFQRAFESYINAALTDPRYNSINKYNEDGTFSPEFMDKINTWLNQNTVKRYTQDYYNEQASIFKQLEEASKNLPAEYNVADLYRKKTQLLNVFRDSDGQVDPALMKEHRDRILAEVKTIQEEINKIQDSVKHDTIRVSAKTKLDINDALGQLSKLRYREPTSYYL